MGVKFNEAKKIISNLVQKGAKLNGGFTIKSAAAKVAPVVGASMILDELRQVPVVKEVLSGLDWLYDTLTDGIKAIPVLGWIAGPVIDNVVKPVASFLGGYKSKEERNEKSWYTGIKEITIPDTADRPIQPGYNTDIVGRIELGAVPRMYHANINLFKPHKMLSWQHEITNLWENLVNNLRRSYTYGIDDISVFMNNNIGYYILGKYLEKKIGFVKFSSPDYPTFREDWITKYDQQQDYGFQYANKFDHLDPTATDQFADSIDAWNITVELERNFLLPPHVKAWIDHYIGSVFLLDAEDTKNWKCIDVTPLSVTLLSIIDGKVVEREVLLRDLNYQWYLQELTKWFKETATLRADVNRAQVQTSDAENVNVLTLLTTGWFTSYEQYSPVLVKDPTFIQALINAYSYNTQIDEVFEHDMVRFDYLDENGKGDPYTILLFAGGVVPSDNMYVLDGHISLRNIAMVVGSYTDNSVIRFPASWGHSVALKDINKYVTYSNQRGVFTINTEAYTTTNDEYTNIDTQEITINTGNATLNDLKTVNASFNSNNLTECTVHFNLREALSSAIQSSVIEGWRSYNYVNVSEVALLVPVSYSCDTSDAQILRNAKAVQYLVIRYNMSTHAAEIVTISSGRALAINSADFDKIAYQRVDVPGYPYFADTVDIMVVPALPAASIHNTLQQNDPVYVSSGSGSSALVFNTDTKELISYNYESGAQHGNILHEYEAYPSQAFYVAYGDELTSNMEVQVSRYFIDNRKMGFNTVIGSLAGVGAFDIGMPSGSNVGGLVMVNTIPTFVDTVTTITLAATLQQAVFVFDHTCELSMLGYAEWFAEVMGYCIPIKNKHRATWNHRNNSDMSSGMVHSFELLKEDYVPFFLSRNDLAYILYYMYGSLFRIGILPYSKKKGS